MARTQVHFVCRQCGESSPRWMGKCPGCGQWNTLEEFREARLPKRDGEAGPFGGATGATPAKAVRMHEIDAAAAPAQRWATGIAEFDRVLGGGGDEQLAQNRSEADDHTAGLVPGSAVLIGGDPGIGKSTLVLQAAAALARSGRRVLYVSSEESLQQVRLRARRLTQTTDNNDLFVLAETNLARILEQVRRTEPDVLMIDSIQMIYKSDLASSSGTVTQLRGCAFELVQLAKITGAALLLIGHVTKQGQIAGPRLLEHMVDTVLYFEGDRFHSHRVIRAIKNRFGTTLEVGLFEMTERGLIEVASASGLLAKEYQPRVGSVVCPVRHGSRCLLVEVQALTAPGVLGAAKRKVSGIDPNRVAMLIAVLEKHGGLRLADQDVFVSSVGGMKIIEPAVDLAIALAIAGAHQNRQVEAGVAAAGEIGLGGEVRHVQHLAQRQNEAARLGFKRMIGPAGGEPGRNALESIPVANISQAMEHLI